MLLPNDKNVVLAAEQAAKLARDVTVIVLPVRNVAQGMAALASWDQGEAPEEAVATMRDAAERAHAIEVTTATTASAAVSRAPDGTTMPVAASCSADMASRSSTTTSVM